MHQQAFVLVLWVTAACVVVGIVAAGTDVARRKWRRRREGSGTAPGSWEVRDPALAVAVQSALSMLAKLNAPRAHTVMVSGSQVLVRFVRPAATPPRLPWKLAAGGPLGGSWEADLAELGKLHHGPPPRTAFVQVGTAGDASVLVDLLAAPGLISISGDQGLACRIANGFVFDLVSNPWSRQIDVVLVGFETDVRVPEPGRVTSLRTLAELRSEDAVEPVQGSVIVLAQPPMGRDAQRVRALLAESGGRSTALCVGPSALAGWILEAVSEDALSVPALGLSVTPAVVEVEKTQLRLFGDYRDDLLIPARATSDDEPTIVLSRPAAPPANDREATAGAYPSISAEVIEVPTQKPREPLRRGVVLPRAWSDTIRTLAAPVTTDAQRAALWPAVVEVRLLGRLEVVALGADVTTRDPVITRLILESLLPDGLSTAALATAMPGVSPAEAVAGDYVWLPIGQSRLPMVYEASGNWRIPADVRVDWHLFQALVDAAEPVNELARLHSALALIRGPLAPGGVGPYAEQVMALTSGATSIVVHTVRRAAELAEKERNLALVEWTLRQGISLFPATEGLWRTLLLFHHQHAAGKLPRAVQEMFSELSSGVRHARLEPETSALLSQLRRDRELWLL
ncbi:hypothetical protein SAMN05216266_11072 [Amycolatopsis marina]|uniref:Transcriptional activator domain-containing protein n=1 Tax=Amycolatopsis marina TaxID=490629 RepID=A0A1I1AQT8_9PSEU|nr:bacterial transcriptional activator domain-containing protein [Amycolatopsis marina]SFB40384.1 hypothetical protein SAMN05216266_11072 [Amycolatopsis marina]